MPLILPDTYCKPLKTGTWEQDYFQVMIDHLNDFKTHVADILDEFVSHSKITDVDRDTHTSAIYNNIDKFCEFYSLYQSGKRIASHRFFNEILEGFDPRFETPYFKKQYKIRFTPFYRMRNDKSILIDMVEKGNAQYTLFHIPFNKRHRCNTARFNSHGTPILYVSDNIHTTWLEINKTCTKSTAGNDRIDVGVFQNSIYFHYYDFTIKDINELIVQGKTSSQEKDNLLDYLYFYPLICGLHSDIEYNNEYAGYRKAYIMPSLIMEYFIERAINSSAHNKMFAFKYSSVKKGADSKSANFAFFAHQKKEAQKYCKELTDVFMPKMANLYHEDIVSSLKLKKIQPIGLEKIRKHILKLVP